MKAAREIFTRDGFESARIEDIAARARKTRGAFYDNFRDKEDIFFAIYEEDIERDQGRVVEALAAAGNLDEHIDILATHFEEMLHDKQRILLNLEFKMYVIRHPQKRKRLTELYSEMCVRCSMTKINTLFPEIVEAPAEKRRNLAMELAIVIDGLALNSLFSPVDVTREQRRRYLRIAAQEAMEAVRRDKA
jgi:AcrR family transcriptional regulator